MAALLCAKDLCKTYVIDKRQNNVLKNVNLEVKEGEMVAIMGPSGSGKSTLLYAISGMDRATSGQVIFEGEDLTKLSEKELAKIRLDEMGFIFQQMYMMKNLTILDNIVLPAAESKKSRESRQEKQERGEQLMRKMGIIDIADNDINEVSGGQLQRACICRSMMNRPKLLFADEPTGNLDTRTTKEVMELMVRLCRKNNQTLVLVTHDRELALYADRIITLIDGKVVDDRPNQSIAQAAAEEVQPQEQEEGAHDFVIPILGKEKQEENNTKTSTEQVANELLPDQLQKAAPTEQQTVQPQKTEREDGE